MPIARLNRLYRKYGFWMLLYRVYLKLHLYTLAPVSDRLGSWMFDKIHGTDTHANLPFEEMSEEDRVHASEDKDLSRPYMPSRPGPFYKMMRTINFPEGSGFIDFGCGKGRTLLLATRYRFARITGVEFSSDLCRAAEKNLALFRNKLKNPPHMEVVNIDASKYVIDDHDNVFFFFNPFDDPIMEKVLDRIRASYARNPRKMWIVYQFSQCSGLVAKEKLFRQIGEYDFHGKGRNYRIYANEEALTKEPRSGSLVSRLLQPGRVAGKLAIGMLVSDHVGECVVAAESLLALTVFLQ
jgi:SAM-dependent methyltransferase